MKDISVIIVEYKSADMVRSALDSLYTLKPKFKIEYIVVSNSGYPPEEQQKAGSTLRDAIMIFNNENVGFAKANNQAMRQAVGRYFLLINPDAKISGSGFFDTIEFMEKNLKVGMIGPLIQNERGATQDSCRRFLTIKRLFDRSAQRMLGRASGGILDYGDYTNRRPVDWISAACILVRRQAVDQVGMMDERYFMYIEDMDWCRRFWRAGWQVWYDPFWQVEHNAHRGSTSTISLSNKLMWIHLQSYGKYYLKWFGLPIKDRDLRQYRQGISKR